MKITMKKTFAVIMALVMCASMFFGLSFSTQAATPNVVNYVYAGNYVYNWGTREEDATFLSPKAMEFYSDNNVSLENLLALSGSSLTSGVPSSELYGKLQELMKSNHTKITSYDGTRDLFMYTDCQNSGNPETISSFYSGNPIGPEWDKGATWNREHTWPNSKGDEAGNGENDIMMLRPASVSENGSRSNKAYGKSTGFYHPNSESDTDENYENIASGELDLRGDVARIMLYQYVRWNCKSNMWGSSGVIESKDVLLDWIEKDPVDTWELGRNDAVESITGTRNVFVDYPELAFCLFDVEVPADYISPSDGTSIEGTGGSDNTGDNTGDNTTSTPGAEIVFTFGDNGAASHKDGSDMGASKSYTADGYTLNLTNASKCFAGAYDAKGNSALKLGTGSAKGSFSMTDIPDDVTSVIFKVAQYKTEATKIKVNGTEHTITTASNNGEYTAIEVDTTSIETIDFTTVTNRCMIDSITFVVAGSSDGDDTTDENKDFVNQDGLVISGPSSAFAENVFVSAKKLTAGNDFTTAQTALADKASQFTLYDITATVGGAAVQPSGEITITLDIPSGYDPDYVCIAYISDDGTVQELESSSVDKVANTVSATLEHFSLYAVIDTSNVSTDDGDDSGNQGGSTTPVYQKITSIDDLTDGKYLIVYETSSDKGVVFDGSLSKLDAGNNVVDAIDLDNGKIAITDALENAYFTITKNGTNYNIKSQSGYYIGSTGSSNQLLSNTSPQFNNSITFTDGNAIIKGTTLCLRFNSSTGSTNYRFRFYSATSQKPIALYKYIEGGSSGGDTPETPTYTITAESSNTSHGTVELSGNVITASAKAGYTLAEGDAAYTIISGNATVERSDNVFIVTPSSDATIRINFEAVVEEPTGGYYVKVEAPLADWSGDYLIVYEDESVAFNGSLEILDASLNNFPVTIENKTIIATATRDAAKFTITKTENGYTVRSASGYYIGHTGSSPDMLNNQSKTYVNTITFENGVFKLLGESGFALQYNDDNGTKRFRYYNGTQKNIAFYKYVDSFDAGVTITATSNDENMGTVTVTGNMVFATAKTGYEIADYTILSGSATVTQEGGMFIVDADGEATIRINFVAKQNKVTFIEREIKSTITATTGATITLPLCVGAIGSNVVFDGWLIEGTEQKFAAGEQYNVIDDVTFVAQFKAVEGESGSGGESVDTDLTLTFDADKTNRTEFSTTKQVWAQNGITLTNNKGKSTNNVADYGGPARFYANSEVIIACDNMVKIVFKANSAAYATDLKNSISDAVVTPGGNVVTVEFKNPCNEFTFTLSKQVRLDSMVVTTRETSASATPVAQITGAQLSVGADLGLSFYTSMLNIDPDANVILRVTIGEDAVEIPRNVNNTIGGEYIFKFIGIAPQRMTDAISATLILIDGDVEIELDAITDYSIYKNATNTLAAYPDDDNLAQLIIDMLYYGAAAQTYTNYNTDSLATDGVEGLGTQSTATPANDDNKLYLSRTTGSVQFRSATVWFDVVNALVVKVNNPSEAAIKVTVKIGDGAETILDYDAQTGGYKTDGILATDFATVYTFTLYEGDTAVQTLNYSINTYAFSKQNSTNMAGLANALYNYGKSAEAYAAAIV